MPTIPSAVNPYVFWKEITAFLVPFPNAPSGVPALYPSVLRLRCNSVTFAPLLPTFNISLLAAAFSFRALVMAFCVPVPTIPSAVSPFAF